jgi:hypothetical protein
MSVLSKLSIVGIVFAPGFTAEAQTQAIRIRVSNVNNGHPLPRQNVSVGLLYAKSEKAPAKYDANLQLETDANGEMEFRLPEPVPVHLSVQVHPISERWHCGCLALAATQDLIHKGIVQASGQGPAINSKTEPGVILFLVRPFTFFERLLYPLMKE